MTVNQSFSNDQIIEYLKISCQLPDIYKHIYQQQIIEETATKNKIVVTDQELQKAADLFRIENELLSSEATLKWLKQYGLSVEDFENLIKKNTLSYKLANYLFSDRIETYFYEHQLDYKEAVIYEIVLNDFDLAMELYYGIKEAEFSFWDIAYRYITDPESRRCRGYKGKVSREELNPELSFSIFAATPPSLLKPIKVNKQTHLIYVQEIIQPELDSELKNEILHNLFDDWLKQTCQEKFSRN